MADDLKSQALNSSQDFYGLLSVPPTASENDIRRAWRKQALKYHPDKVGPNNTSALEKFHLLQIAQDVLCDPIVRELYDNARRAKEEKKARDAAFEGRRKAMKEDLERRESGALKRKREEMQAEEEFERELRRIAEDGKRRRKEREEQLKREAVEIEEEERRQQELEISPDVGQTTHENTGPSEVDRSITVRFKKDDSASHLDKDRIISLFERFGPIEEAVLREKKIKIEGEKHRQIYMTTIIVYKSIVGAHVAVSDVSKLQKEDPKTWSCFECVDWAGRKEPECIPKAPPVQPIGTPVRSANRQNIFHNTTVAPSTPQANGNGLRKVPSFASFRGMSTSTPRGPNSPSNDEIMMIRLRNAEKRRLEEKIRAEEDTAAAASDLEVA